MTQPFTLTDTEPSTEDNAFTEALAEALATDAAATPLTPRPAAPPSIKNISHVHEALMNWMLLYPERNLGECAAAFGYSQAWLSTIIHSNLFQARLKEKQEAIFSGVKEDLHTKMGALADVGLEKLQAQMETSANPKFILETTKLALTSLGFGSARSAPANNVNAQNVQQNFYVASQADLVAARERITGGGGVSSPAQPEPLTLDEATPNTQPQPVPVAAKPVDAPGSK